MARRVFTITGGTFEYAPGNVDRLKGGEYAYELPDASMQRLRLDWPQGVYDFKKLVRDGRGVYSGEGSGRQGHAPLGPCRIEEGQLDADPDGVTHRFEC